MDRSLRPRCAACAPRPVPLPRPRAPEPCLLLEVDGALHRAVALQHAHGLHRHASRGDARRVWKDGQQKNTPQEGPALTEARPPPIFYMPGPSHAHPGTEPIVTRGLRPPKVALRGRRARWGRGRAERRLLERGDQESSKGGYARKLLLSPPHGDGRVVAAETENARPAWRALEERSTPPRNAACGRLWGARRNGALKAGVRHGARCVSSFLVCLYSPLEVKLVKPMPFLCSFLFRST